MKLPKFLLYGQNDPNIEGAIQPTLALRQWEDLSDVEKQTALQEIENCGWFGPYSEEILQTIEFLNYKFLRKCPGKNLHAIKPKNDPRALSYDSDRMDAALRDFKYIFLHEESDALVFLMLSRFVESYIDGFSYQRAAESRKKKERKEYIDSAFSKFDSLANCLNHIFEQFAVNQMVTRNGFVPRQDSKIMDEIYTPTLAVLADPKWEPVSINLAKMFEDYREKNYAEAITKAHSAVQRFFQILVGEEGKNSKGEVGVLFKKAKDAGIISTNRFIEPIVVAIQGFIPSERATNSTAKPAIKEATAADALLMMNVVMILLQHCLQNI